MARGRHAGPRYLTTGPMLRVPGGYGSEAHGSVETPGEVEAALDRIQAIGGVGVKLAIEAGIGPWGGMRLYPPELPETIVRAAGARSLPL